MTRRILTIALLAIALVFTGSAGGPPQSPYTMGDANPHHEFVGPTLPSGTDQP